MVRGGASYTFFLIVFLCHGTRAVRRGKWWDMQHVFYEGEAIPVYSRGMSSAKQPRIRHDYSTLPVCTRKGEETHVLAPNMTRYDAAEYWMYTQAYKAASDFFGIHTQRLNTVLRMNKTTNCVQLCSPVKADLNTLQRLSDLISHEYYVSYIVGGLPVTRGSKEWTEHPRFGVLLGRHVIGQGTVLNNHVHFRIHVSDGKVARVDGIPRSHLSCDQIDRPLILDPRTRIAFSVSAEYISIPTDKAARRTFMHYVGTSEGEADVALMYIVPPVLCMVFVLYVYFSTVVFNTRSDLFRGPGGSILQHLRGTLPADALVRIFVADADTASVNWKKIKDHVIKAPVCQTLLAVLSGYGIQGIFTVLSIVVYGICGFYYGPVADKFAMVIYAILNLMSPFVFSVVTAIVLQITSVHAYRGERADVRARRMRRDMERGADTDELATERLVSSGTYDGDDTAFNPLGGPESELMSAEEIDEYGADGQTPFSWVIISRLMSFSNIASVLGTIVIYTVGFHFLFSIIYRERIAVSPESKIPRREIVDFTTQWYLFTIGSILTGNAAGRILYVPTQAFRPSKAENISRSIYPRGLFIATRVCVCALFGGMCTILPILGFFRSFWNSNIDYAFVYLFINVVITAITMVFLVNIFVFQILCRSDERWQWPAFHLGGSVAWAYGFMAFWYYVFSPIQGKEATIIFVAYSATFFFVIYVSFGAMCYLFSYYFVTRLYQSIRTE